MDGRKELREKVRLTIASEITGDMVGCNSHSPDRQGNSFTIWQLKLPKLIKIEQPEGDDDQTLTPTFSIPMTKKLSRTEKKSAHKKEKGTEKYLKKMIKGDLLGNGPNREFNYSDGGTDEEALIKYRSDFDDSIYHPS